jgi:hypothetical protein
MVGEMATIELIPLREYVSGTPAKNKREASQIRHICHVCHNAPAQARMAKQTDGFRKKGIGMMGPSSI